MWRTLWDVSNHGVSQGLRSSPRGRSTLTNTYRTVLGRSLTLTTASMSQAFKGVALRMPDTLQRFWFYTGTMIFDVRHVLAVSLAPGREGFNVYLVGFPSPVLVSTDRCSKLTHALLPIFGQDFAAALDELTGKDVRALGRSGARAEQ
jgi:hypothetical protein